jgi:hypothetical protein
MQLNKSDLCSGKSHEAAHVHVTGLAGWHRHLKRDNNLLRGPLEAVQKYRFIHQGSHICNGRDRFENSLLEKCFLQHVFAGNL